MSDSMPLLATTANSQSSDATGLSSLSGKPGGKTPGEDFSDLLHASLNPLEQDPGSITLMLAEGESLPVLATSEASHGNSLPQQPLVNWSVLMSWDGTTRGDMQQTQPELVAAGKPVTPIPATNIQGMANNGMQPVQPAPADAVLLDKDFTQMAEEQKLQSMNMPMPTKQKLPLLEQNLLSSSELPHQTNQQGNLQSPGSIAALSATGTQRTDQIAGSQITVPPQHPNWSQAVAERMQWMIGQDIHKAELRLDPPELGTLEVHIQVSKEQASVTFTSANAQVRDAVESATARLREMFAEAGLSLGDVNVSQESFSQQRDGDSDGAASANTALPGGEMDSDDIEQNPVKISDGTVSLLDTYA